MIKALLAFIVISVAVVLIFIFNKYIGQKSQTPQVQNHKVVKEKDSEISDKPDKPVPFGYKCMWFAVRTQDVESVINLPFFKNPRKSNWKYGISRAYESNEKEVFITPSISGWVLIAGTSMPELPSKKWKTLMNELGKKFKEVQYFATHRVVDYHAWAKLIDGKIVRAFGYIGESGEVLMNVGKMDDNEQSLGIYLPSSEASDEDFEKAKYPDEEHVMKMAGFWSINPTQLEEMRLPESNGYVASFEF